MEPSDNESANRSNSAELTDTLAAYVALVNREGFIEFAGQCEGGLTPEKLVGQKVFDRVPSVARQILADKLRTAFETKTIEFIDMPAPEHCDNGGGIEIRLVPLVESGRPLQTVAVAFRRTLVMTRDRSRLADPSTPFSRVPLDELPCERSLIDRQRMATRLQQSEERFRQIAEVSPQGIVIVQHDRVVYANPTACTIVDLAAKKLAGQTVESVIEQFVTSDSLELMRAKQKELDHGLPLGSPYEIKIRTALGQTRWIEVTATPVTYEGDQSIQAAVIDITARKEAEEALRNSEERYRTLVENAQNAIFSMEYDGTLLFLNPIAAGMLGGQPSDYTGKNVLDLFPPEIAARHLAAVRRIIDSGKGETIESLTSMRGQPRWQMTSIHPLNGHNGQTRSAFMISTDITESKLAAQKLARERDFTKMILQTANSLIFCLDKDARILLFNEECERVTGYSGDEVIGKRWPDIFMPERYRHDGLDNFGAWVYQHPADRREEPILTKSGEERIILWSNSSFIHPDTGEITAIAIGYDVTLSKLAEEQLRESERRFKDLADLLPQIIFECDVDGRLTFINKSGLELFGRTSEEVERGATIFDGIHPKDHERVRESVGVIARGGSTRGNEYAAVRSDGTEFPVVAYSSLILRGGDVVGYRGILVDVTERKQAEQELVDLKVAVEQSVEGIAKAELDGKIVFANPAWARMHGYEVEEIMGKHLYIFHTQEQVERDVIPFNKIVEEQGSHQGKVGHVRKDGSTFPTYMSTTLIRDEHNTPVGMIGAAIDITEREHSERLLRQSQEAFRDLVENVDDVLYTTDHDLVVTYVSPVVKNVLGYDPVELVGRSALSLVYSEDLPTIQAAVQDVLNGSLYPSEYRMIAKSGEVRWIRSLSRPIFEGDVFMGVRGVLADIHERKLTEQALRDSQKRFERVAQQSREMVWEVDTDGLFTYVSQACDEILDYRPDEMIGRMHFYDLQPEEEREKFKLASLEQIAKRVSFHNQINKAITKNGRVVWFLTSGAPAVDERGNLKGYVGADLDITERMEMERDLTVKDRAIASSINALGLADLDGRITYVNDAFVRMWGYASQELLGIPMTQLAFDPGDVTAVMSAIKTKGQYFGESVAKRKDGTTFDIQVSASLVTDASGQSLAMLATFIDITERKRNEAAVRISEERFRALYKGNPLPTYTWQWNGSEFVLVDCNNAASSVTEGRIRNYLGLTANEIYPNQPDYVQDLQICYENQATINREMKYFTHLSTGKTLELAVRYNFVPPDFVLVVTEDITQRKRDEEALRMSEERFRALYNGSPLPTILFQWKDGDLQLISCNEATTSASYGTLPNSIGGPAMRIFSREPEFRETLYECFHKQTSIDLDYSHQMWNSDKQTYLSVFAAFVPPDLLLVQAQDISERKQMEEALRSANELLAREHHALLEKNIAIKEVLGQIKDEANQVKLNVQSNIDKLILPILGKLKEKSRESDRIDLDLLESLLSDVSSPFLHDIESRFVQLTPRETEICNMIRNGLQSKEIGPALGISVRTVEKFRQKIRDKLCVDSRDVNLTTFLRSITQKR